MPHDITDLEEGQYVYDTDSVDVYTISALDIDHDDEGLPKGEDTLDVHGTVVTHSAKEFDEALVAGKVHILSDEVAENAEDILIKFAKKEIQSYRSRVGVSHDYNGIPSVETVRDIQAAVKIHNSNL